MEHMHIMQEGIDFESVKGELNVVDVDTPPPTILDIQNPLLRHPNEAIASEAIKKQKGSGMEKAVFGPQCWKCYEWDLWWECQRCKKGYHKRCAFFGPTYPHPVFNMAWAEAVDAEEKGMAVMMKCTQCIIAEETTTTSLKNVPPGHLMALFGNVAKMMETQFKMFMTKINDGSVVASPTLIANTVSTGCYKTLEGFVADFKLIKFQTVRRYGVDSEQTEVITMMLKVLQDELMALVMCWECYLRRYDNLRLGKLLPAHAFYRVMEASCNVPHPVIWVYKLPDDTNPTYWPAKLLFINVNEEAGTRQLWFHCFEEKAVRFNKPGDEIEYFCYSTQDLNNSTAAVGGRRKRKKIAHVQQQLKKIMASCERYLAHLRGRFGAAEVIVPEQATPLTGDYEECFKRMFPNLNMDAMIPQSHAGATTLARCKADGEEDNSDSG